MNKNQRSELSQNTGAQLNLVQRGFTEETSNKQRSRRVMCLEENVNVAFTGTLRATRVFLMADFWTS